MSEVCPLCRAPLPPGPEKLYELGLRVWMKLSRIHREGPETKTWPPLSAAHQEEMDGVIVMMQEATDQVGNVSTSRLSRTITNVSRF